MDAAQRSCTERAPYTHEDKTVILTVVNRYQAIKLRKYTREVDPHSFVLITNSTEIIGKGFRGLM